MFYIFSYLLHVLYRNTNTTKYIRIIFYDIQWKKKTTTFDKFVFAVFAFFAVFETRLSQILYTLDITSITLVTSMINTFL